MNITIIVGWVVCWALVVFGILSGGQIPWFIDMPSVLITIGGSIAATAACYPGSVLKTVPKLLMMSILPKKYEPEKYITELVEYAGTARSKGLLALEESANKAEDPFVKQALMLIVDANDPDKVRAMLEDGINFMEARHANGRSFFEKAISMGPAFGMIGTLVGLVIMLRTMAENPDGLGDAMAVAIITTFYGSLLANVVFSPIEASLKQLNDAEVLCMQIVVEGVMAIAAGSNPRLIQEKLEFMLPRSASAGKSKK